MIDGNSNKLISNITLDRKPTELVFNPVNGYLYVINPDERTMSIIDAKGVQISTVPLELSTDDDIDIDVNPRTGNIYLTSGGSPSNDLYIIPPTMTLNTTKTS